MCILWKAEDDYISAHFYSVVDVGFFYDQDGQDQAWGDQRDREGGGGGDGLQVVYD